MFNKFQNKVIELAASGEKVSLAGFGYFKRQYRSARMGVNPQTKERIEIPETYTVKFRAFGLFREKVKVLK